MSKIIKTNINNEEIPVLINRHRSSNITGYKALIKSLMDHMTEAQIQSVVKTYNSKSIIVMDNIVKLFDYEGYNEESLCTHCICGVHIVHNHIIRNIETSNNCVIGSTCCDHWIRNTIHSYKINDHKRDMKTMFNVLKNLYLSAPKMKVGKYKNIKMRWIVEHDINYARYVERDFKRFIKNAMKQCIEEYA